MDIQFNIYNMDITFNIYIMDITFNIYIMDITFNIYIMNIRKILASYHVFIQVFFTKQNDFISVTIKCICR